MSWLDDRIDEWHKSPGRSDSLHSFLGMSWELYRIFVESPPQFVLGIDETGWGPYAGPLVVGGVLAPIEWSHPALRDSKATSSERGRGEILKQLEQVPGARYFLHRTEAPVIDTLTPARARLTAFEIMIRSVMSQAPERTLIVVDGNVHVKGIEHAALPKADSFVPQVMAASLIAKVSRDTEMIELSKRYPEYNFADNKGYGTHEHEVAIKKHGLCPLHRRSYTKKFAGSST